MTELNIRQTKDQWLDLYPDCPQREMALQLLRRGHIEQAQAWIDALIDLRNTGQSNLFASAAPAKSARR
ncbi:hypothetical protein CSC82_16800 [Rhodobacteraceae bacterium 4F10]|nr:hypothetical protein CSC82_16800 [Rhodobacteraceae bacterium 4F10]